MPSTSGLPRIVPAVSADRPAVHDLLRRSGLTLDGLDEHAATLLVAREEGRVVATAALEAYGSAVLLRSVAVDAAHRGRGLGQALTHAALDAARQAGARHVYLLTETAEAFFARLGFRAVPRSEVAPAVRQSVEFTSACPASARVMLLDLA